MTFWDDTSDDMSDILEDATGPSVEVTHAPQSGGAGATLPVVLIRQGRADDANAYKVLAHVYFSRQDLESPQYQDTLTTADGEIWKLMRDIGSNEDLMRWEAERDLRLRAGKG